MLSFLPHSLKTKAKVLSIYQAPGNWPVNKHVHTLTHTQSNTHHHILDTNTGVHVRGALRIFTGKCGNPKASH